MQLCGTAVDNVISALNRDVCSSDMLRADSSMELTLPWYESAIKFNVDWNASNAAAQDDGGTGMVRNEGGVTVE